MKKSQKIVLTILFACCLLFFHHVSADSGWDASYGGGSSGSSSYGSSSWGSSLDPWDYSHSSSSSSSGSRSHTSSGDDVVAIIAFFLLLFIIISGGHKNKKTSNGMKIERYNNYQIVPYKVEKIKKLLPNFSKEEFKEQAYNIYINIQKSWMNFDYDTLRKYTTDELYNLYYSQLVALNMKKQKNIMEGFSLHDFEIVAMEHNETSLSLRVRMMVECFDYVVDEKNIIIRGSDMYKLLYDYEMTFIIGLGKKNNKCPNCNAPLDNQQSSVCPYCNSTIISDKHDWVLSKKQMIRQQRK